MADEFDGKHGEMVSLTYVLTNAVTAQTAVDLIYQQAGITTAVMPKAGSVVGISVKASAAITVSTITFQPHNGSTEWVTSGAISAILTTAAATTSGSYAVVRKGVMKFAAGDGVGVSYTTTTTTAPTSTNDFNATLFVVFDKD